MPRALGVLALEGQARFRVDTSDDLERSVDNLRRSVDALLRCTAVIEEPGSASPETSAGEQAQPLADRLLSIGARLHLTQILAERQVIAVAGLQGAGKSTLVMKLYGLRPDELPTNIGRGEQLPVLITEGEAESTAVWRLVRTGDDTDVRHETIERAEFLRIVRAPAAAELLLELHLPQRHFGKRGPAILLLPGFEEGSQRWLRLTEQALSAATACVFVTNPTRIAAARNQELMKRIAKRFSAARSLVAITGADAVPTEERDDLVRAVADQLGIPPEAHDRILLTGTTLDLVTRWVPQLKEKLNEIALPDARAKAARLEDLDLLVSEDLGLLLTELQDRADRLRRQDDLDRFHGIEQILEQFDDEVKRLGKRYEKGMREASDKHGKAVRDALAASISEPGFFNRAYKTLFGENIDDMLKTEQKLEETWSGSPILQDEHARVLADVVAHSLQLHLQSGPSDHRPAVDAYTLPPAASSPKPQSPQSPLLQDTTEKDLQALMVRGARPDDLSPSVRKSVRTVPALALEYVRLGTIDPMLFKVAKEPGVAAGGSQIATHVQTSSETQKRVFAALGAMLVADGAFDGKIDSLPNLMTAFGVSGGLGGAVFLAAGVAVAGVTLGIALNRAVVQRDLGRLNAFEAAVKALREATLQRALEAFDEFMDSLRRYLTERLRQVYRLDNAWARYQRLHMALAQASDARVEFREALRRARKMG